jgi:DNA-binding transcriptional LysR family regulator
MTFDDPLLVRAGRGMVPTALADRLGPPLTILLGQLDDLVREQAAFRPATSTRTFRIACLDHFSVLHLPDLVGSLRECAPGVQVVVTQLSYDTLSLELESGAVDVGIGVFTDEPAGLMQRTLHQERFQSLLRSSHPAEDGWCLESFLAHSHGLLTTTGRGLGSVDRALAKLGHERQIALRLPHFLAAGAIAESSDLIFTVAGRLARSFTAHHDVTVLQPPIDLPVYPVVMRWHRRGHEDPAHRWFRDQMARVAAGGLD